MVRKQDQAYRAEAELRRSRALVLDKYKLHVALQVIVLHTAAHKAADNTSSVLDIVKEPFSVQADSFFGPFECRFPVISK